MKRVFDLMASLIGGIILVPLFLIIGLLVYLNDRGPVFFTQQRVGLGGRMFTLYKFRSMRMASTAPKDTFEPGDTSRITPVGRFLRRTKLDELPQLLNVIKGDMSIVGPRPEVRKWVEAFPEQWKTILTIRPGITDVASLEFIDEESLLAQSKDPEKTYKNIILPHKIKLYEDYVSDHSLAGDLKLICKTFFTMMK